LIAHLSSFVSSFTPCFACHHTTSVESAGFCQGGFSQWVCEPGNSPGDWSGFSCACMDCL
jgi:hypothetical protein